MPAFLCDPPRTLLFLATLLPFLAILLFRFADAVRSNILVRFGRGLGLRFVRRLNEWRPGREGRQEVIKVKVFEGQNVMFRGVVVERHRQFRTRREDGQGGDAGGGGRLAKKMKSGTVMVATITPDKLVRFWTSGGDAIGCLDQVKSN